MASDEDEYIAKMIKRGRTEAQAKQYWDQKSGNAYPLLDDDDEAVGGTLGGTILRARDPDYAGYNIYDIIPDSKRHAVPRTESVIIDQATGETIKVFRKTGIQVIRRIGDYRRFHPSGRQRE